MAMKRATLVLAVFYCLQALCLASASAGEDADRSMFVDDGSFENGICGAGSGWTCWSNTSCANWIIDPLPVWGVPAKDGAFVAQLGGSCETELNSNSFCQDIDITWPCGFWVEWSWMGIVDEGKPGTFRVTVDGGLVADIGPEVIVDTQGLWEIGWASIWGHQGIHSVCFEFEAGSTESAMLIDTVSNPISPTPALPLSLSAVKSLY